MFKLEVIESEASERRQSNDGYRELDLDGRHAGRSYLGLQCGAPPSKGPGTRIGARVTAQVGLIFCRDSKSPPL